MAGILDATSIGPVDVAVVGFEGDAFTGEIAPALMDLVEAGTVRIIDLAFIRKSADGEASFVEMVDSDVSDAYASLTDDQFDLLNDVDLESMADGLEPADRPELVQVEHHGLRPGIGIRRREQMGHDAVATGRSGSHHAAVAPESPDPSGLRLVTV